MFVVYFRNEVVQSHKTTLVCTQNKSADESRKDQLKHLKSTEPLRFDRDGV